MLRVLCFVPTIMRWHDIVCPRKNVCTTKTLLASFYRCTPDAATKPQHGYGQLYHKPVLPSTISHHLLVNLQHCMTDLFVHSGLQPIVTSMHDFMRSSESWDSPSWYLL